VDPAAELLRATEPKSLLVLSWQTGRLQMYHMYNYDIIIYIIIYIYTYIYIYTVSIQYIYIDI
jgi:hypothetical protein